MGQNLLLLPERSPDTLSFSDGAQGLYGSSVPNSAVFHTLMVRCLYQLPSIQGVLFLTCLISVSESSCLFFTLNHFSTFVLLQF